MASVLRRLSSSSFSFLHKNPGPNPIRCEQAQQSRGLRIRVRNGNVEQALSIMERRMKQSGMERLIKRYEDHEVYHMKNSEKRVLARKKLQVRIRSQNLARKLQTIIVNKIRGQ
ncbi:uncharacterized protein M6B38_262895 [Iris pallida]|uniref:Ribosomal protein S21 n=1 Tax=Iris pallida TaxID=29817 RepID=A0AAX6IDW8_IRIPA|nr:uncharacterized protein M6B38_418635 [Iris pallida]KAJ6851047.1 uncharacterized protein M6B38_262895 [Iris pallida]